MEEENRPIYYIDEEPSSDATAYMEDPNGFIEDNALIFIDPINYMEDEQWELTSNFNEFDYDEFIEDWENEEEEDIEEDEEQVLQEELVYRWDVDNGCWVDQYGHPKPIQNNYNNNYHVEYQFNIDTGRFEEINVIND